MFQGWSRSNNPQALTTVPRAAWHQGVLSSTVSPGNQVASELKCYKEGRGRLDTFLKEVIGANGTVHHLIPGIGVEIAEIEPAAKGFF